MKPLRLVLLSVMFTGILLFIPSCICPGNICPENTYIRNMYPHGVYSIFYDFADFKKARMDLFENQDYPGQSETRNAMSSPCGFPNGSTKGYGTIQGRQYDLDGDGVFERYILQKGRLTVRSGPDVLWRTPEDWWVDQFFIGDITNDGNLKLGLSVWKEGSFGPYKPFWIEKDDTAVKNHLFIFRLEEDEFKPLWQSSNLDYPIDHAALIEPGGDGKVKLMVRESSYTDPERSEVTLWEWKDWGFYRVLFE